MSDDRPQSPVLPRILMECTETYENDIHTGIQRVVRNLVQESPAIGRELGIECRPVVWMNGTFRLVPGLPDESARRARATVAPSARWKTLRSCLAPVRWLARRIVSQRTREALRSRLRTLVRRAGRRELRLPPEVDARPDDVLILLDASWNQPLLWSAVQEFRRRGGTVGALVYDLLPVRYPHFWHRHRVLEVFSLWVDSLLHHTDFVMAISETTRGDVECLVREKSGGLVGVGPQGTEHAQRLVARFDSFRLGANLDKVVHNGEIRPQLDAIFGRSGQSCTYLTVGTIEPRKNHAYLLDAFEHVWRDCPETTLCIVGRVGWHCDHVLKRIESHPLRGTRLFLFHDVNDTELDFCYRRAKALVFPSIAEGFGLPIVEALQHNLLVLASDTPIHREVGKDFCAYFALSDCRSLADLVVAHERDGRRPLVRDSRGYHAVSWSESCREMLTKSLALAGERSNPLRRAA